VYNYLYLASLIAREHHGIVDCCLVHLVAIASDARFVLQQFVFIFISHFKCYKQNSKTFKRLLLLLLMFFVYY